MTGSTGLLRRISLCVVAWASLAPIMALAQAPAAASAQAPAPSLLSPTPITVAPPPPVPAPVLSTPAVAPVPAATPAPSPSAAIPGAVAPPGEPTPTVAVRAKPKRVAPPPPRETALSTSLTPTLQPETFFLTAKASERYAAIADAGGWPTVAKLAPGAKGKAVATLRLRLAIEGDLGAPTPDGGAPPSDTFSTVWGPEVTAAVERFQERHGLRRTGVVAGATLKAMNVPAQARFRQLSASARRLAGQNFPFGERYAVVNIPSASVEAVDGGRVARRYVAVVGDVGHPSPEVEAKVVAVNLNPTWTVPTSIIKNEIIPKMQRDPGYLTRAKIRILDGQGQAVNPASIDWSSQRAVAYTLRQDSGVGNSLGAIRLNMPNRYSVYMHDTPSKRLFGGDYRFLSHGCVRVQGVYDLAQWMLDGTPAPAGAWDKTTLLAKVGEADRADLKLARPVPVAWVYLTGWADGDGTASFRDDVYGLDALGEAQARADVAPR